MSASAIITTVLMRLPSSKILSRYFQLIGMLTAYVRFADVRKGMSHDGEKPHVFISKHWFRNIVARKRQKAAKQVT
jgi:hypothetical protein